MSEENSEHTNVSKAFIEGAIVAQKDMENCNPKFILKSQTPIRLAEIFFQDKLAKAKPTREAAVAIKVAEKALAYYRHKSTKGSFEVWDNLVLAMKEFEDLKSISPKPEVE